MAVLSREERETIILYTEADDRAEVYTHNKKMINRLAKLYAERPDEVEKIREADTGAVTYTVPRDWVKIIPKRRLSEEQRAAITDRFAAMRVNQS
jgi:hypothetical protein